MLVDRLIVILLTMAHAAKAQVKNRRTDSWFVSPATNRSTFVTTGRLVDGVRFGILQADLNLQTDEKHLRDTLEVLERAKGRKLGTAGLLDRAKALQKAQAELGRALMHAARAPRQVLAAAAVGLVGGAAAYFVNQAMKSSAATAGLQTEMKHLTARFEGNLAHNQALRDNVVDMKHVLKRITNKVAGDADEWKLTTAAEDVLLRLQRKCAAIFQLLNGRLGPEALELTGAENALSQLIADGAKEHGEDLMPVYPDIRSVLMEDAITRVDLMSGNVTVLLPVPLVNVESMSTWTLLKRIPEPVEHEGRVFGVRPEADMLGTRPDGTAFLELRNSDLTECRRFRGDHLCMDKFPQRKPTQPGCLTALYLASEHVGSCCELQRLTPPTVTSLDRTRFSMFMSEKGEDFTVRCRRPRRHGSIKVQGLQVLQLGETCTAESAAFRVEATGSRSPKVATTVTELLPHLTWNNESKDPEIRGVLQEIQGIRTAVETHRHGHQDEDGPKNWSLEAALALMWVLAAFITYGALRNLSRKQQALAERFQVVENALQALQHLGTLMDESSDEEEDSTPELASASSEDSFNSNPGPRPRPTGRHPGKTPPPKRQRTGASPRKPGESQTLARAAAATAAALALIRTPRGAGARAQTGDNRPQNRDEEAMVELTKAPRPEPGPRKTRSETDTPTSTRSGRVHRPKPLLLTDEIKKEPQEIEMALESHFQGEDGPDKSGSGERSDPGDQGRLSVQKIGAAYRAASKKK